MQAAGVGGDGRPRGGVWKGFGTVETSVLDSPLSKTPVSSQTPGGADVARMCKLPRRSKKGKGGVWKRFGKASAFEALVVIIVVGKAVAAAVAQSQMRCVLRSKKISCTNSGMMRRTFSHIDSGRFTRPVRRFSGSGLRMTGLTETARVARTVGVWGGRRGMV